MRGKKISVAHSLKKLGYEKEKQKQVTERRNRMGRLSVKEGFFFKVEKISPCLNGIYEQ